MVHVTASAKASLSASIQSTISNLTALKAKINADTDEATLATDFKSITKGERIYMLVAPQLRITVTADRASTIADMIEAMNTKIEARVMAAQTEGKDVSVILTAQTDLLTKTTHAKAEATMAINAVAGLAPDNGDQSIMASNETALKGARADILLAQKDLQDARKDIDTILKALKGFQLNAKGEAKEEMRLNSSKNDDKNETENKNQ